MKKKTMLWITIVLCLIIVIFIFSNHKSQNTILTLGTEYGLRIGNKDLYTLTIDEVSKVQSETDFDIILIEYTYTNKNIDEDLVINQDNFKCNDNSNKQLDYINYQKIKNKPIPIKKGDSYTAQVTYKVPKDTNQILLKLYTKYTDNETTFELPIH